MATFKSGERIKWAIHAELAALGICADNIEANATSADDWTASIHIAGRKFEVGSEPREGFFCWESTEGRTKNFVASDCGAIRGDQNRLRKSGLDMIYYAIAHPEFSGTGSPIV